MPTIHINVSNKIATNPLREHIVCGNSDYVAEFAFDAEWDEHREKTARFNFNGKYEERIFTGNTVEIPIITNAVFVEIGVYSGNLITTTGAVIECTKSVLCGNPVHEDPPEDIYIQLLEHLKKYFPEIKENDEGKFMRVVSGVAIWQSVPEAERSEF